MPKYAALIYGEEIDPATVSPEERSEVMGGYMEFGRNNEAAIVAGEALHDSSSATTVHVEGGKGGKPVYTDGPFAETKEVLGGFYVLECPDLDTALEVAAQIPGAWHGRIEVRPVVEFDEEGNTIG
ncbi:MAG TPA: YciI family protein [Acidimicrobiia bacterium]|nr:YciI family protein [Acidimicrobiia bacterium]